MRCWRILLLVDSIDSVDSVHLSTESMCVVSGVLCTDTHTHKKRITTL